MSKKSKETPKVNPQLLTDEEYQKAVMSVFNHMLNRLHHYAFYPAFAEGAERAARLQLDRMIRYCDAVLEADNHHAMRSTTQHCLENAKVVLAKIFAAENDEEKEAENDEAVLDNLELRARIDEIRNEVFYGKHERLEELCQEPENSPTPEGDQENARLLRQEREAVLAGVKQYRVDVRGRIVSPAPHEPGGFLPPRILKVPEITKEDLIEGGYFSLMPMIDPK
jgi:hypothetical protein